MFFETVQRNTLANWLSVFMPSSRIFVLYLLTSLLVALFAYWQIERAHAQMNRDQEGEAKPKKGFFAFVFDRDVYLHASSKQDYKIFALNALLYYGIAAQFLISVPVFAAVVNTGLVSLFGTPAEPLISSLPAMIGYTLAAILLFDFGVFLMHYIVHKVPVLWHFHAVHHSAEQLNPISLFRMHPLDLFLTGLSTALMSGIGFGAFFFLTKQHPQEITFLGLNVVLFLFYLLGYNLRHSHIWLNYPAWLSNIFISPAQHQVHHSIDPKHWDRNMGLIFAFWDKLFGTLYVPRGYEKLQYGVRKEEPNPFGSMSEIYLKPFSLAAATIKTQFQTREKRAVVYAGVAAAVGVYAIAVTAASHTVIPWAKPKLELAELTWIEAHDAIKKGYDAVIIPTGGTEQGGPFVALGKHNLIVRHTALKIAQKASNTLVAPVMAYVPEGDAEPVKTGHMTYAGTLSLPEPVFESVLEATALSLKAHGFKWIYLLGDSGDSQASQQRVAERLSARWAGTGVRVVQLDQYYFANGQKDALMEQGFTEQQIGTHAGVRDTSELMAVEPKAVRFRNFTLPAEHRDHGANGAPSLATAGIGRKLLELKIAAGTRQIAATRTINDRPLATPGPAAISQTPSESVPLAQSSVTAVTR